MKVGKKVTLKKDTNIHESGNNYKIINRLHNSCGKY